MGSTSLDLPLADPAKVIDRTEEFVEKGIVGNGDVVTEHPGEGIEIKRGCGTLFVPESDLQRMDQIGEEMAAEESAGITLDENVAKSGNVSCQHCGKTFWPRSRSGGKPQKFCSTECRRAADAGRKPNAANAGQREDQREENPVPEPKMQGSASADNSDGQEAWKAEPMTCTKGEFMEVVRAVEKAARPVPPADFDWHGDDCVILQEQQQTAIYFNNSGGLVIRQRNWPEDDQVVIIVKDCIERFHDKLCDALGIGSIGRCD